MAACVPALTLAADTLRAGNVMAAWRGGVPVGVAEVSTAGRSGHLEKLFVDPPSIGSGTGRLLFGWAVNELERREATEMWIEADPAAVPFYRRMGALPAGEAPSGAIPGRMLPRLLLRLTV